MADGPGPIEAGQRRLAARRLLDALRRLHRSDPMAPDVRADVLIARLRMTAPAAARHRGGSPLRLDDAGLRDVLDELVAEGRILRRGHRVRLPDHRPSLGPEMRARADRLLAELRAGGLAPPRAEPAARRLGIPPGVLDALRAAGELVAVANGIDYPADGFAEAAARIAELRRERVPSTGEIARRLGVPRRHAEGLRRALETGSAVRSRREGG